MLRHVLFAACATIGAALVFAANPAAAHGQNLAASAHHAGQPLKVPAILAVEKKLAPPPAGVAELRFRDIFKLPVGPRGLEPTEKLRSLDGKRVRIVGYMIAQETPVAGSFMLSPLPVMAGDEDESLADDIPPSALFVVLPRGRSTVVPALPGLVKLTGTLRVGAEEIPGSGRVAAARLELDAEPERALLKLARKNAARHPAAAAP